VGGSIMKKKVKMICILKSGQKIEDRLVFKKSDTCTIKAIEQMRIIVEDYFAHTDKYKENSGVVSFGKTTILMSEVAAITFKEN
jgi:hypothetical protein